MACSRISSDGASLERTARFNQPVGDRLPEIHERQRAHNGEDEDGAPIFASALATHRFGFHPGFSLRQIQICADQFGQVFDGQRARAKHRW